MDSSGSSEPSPRWWGRWRRSRSPSPSMTTGRPAVSSADEPEIEGVVAYLERCCRQISPYLPNLSSATRKAIVCVVVLVVAWRLALWALELVVTVVCCVVGVLLVTCLVRPDTGLWLLTSVLPPYIQEARMWIASFCLHTGQVLLGGRPTPPQIQQAQPSTPRSTRTICSRSTTFPPAQTVS